MYIGRFAPSPTGPLHFGSLVAAVASYCEARTHTGKWLLRMENLDKPREVAGAADMILRQLERFGFEWDGDVVYQNERTALYAEAFDVLKQQKQVYPCTCTRKEIADSSTQLGIEGIIYPGTCMHHPLKAYTPAAWRIKTPDLMISFEDAIQGVVKQNLAQDIGDFIIKRADGLFAYQLAVVVDDADQHITHIVRGADLIDSTPRQIYLQQQLGYHSPVYAHVPVACNIKGEKLSKQTLAQALDTGKCSSFLYDALTFLGQQPPEEIKYESIQTLWGWALQHWQSALIPKTRALVSS